MSRSTNRSLRLAGILAALLIGVLRPSPASAAMIFNLDCILNTNPCTPGSIYGTVTLDQSGADISVVVDLSPLGVDGGQTFRDLMLNYTGTATNITDNDPNNVVTLLANGFSINPYNGLFDVGDVGNPVGTLQGWNGDDGYSALLSTSSVGGLTLADFVAKDSSGASGVYVALHIQNIGPNGCDGGSTISGTNPCVPGQTGTGSLKIGGRLAPTVRTIPEPGLMMLLGSGLGALVYKRRRAV